jgi:hypothetical protein
MCRIFPFYQLPVYKSLVICHKYIFIWCKFTKYYPKVGAKKCKKYPKYGPKLKVGAKKRCNYPKVGAKKCAHCYIPTKK